jgi:outer membrane protein assembly factor BamE (lipoprotein component of BamABCDE complex)
MSKIILFISIFLLITNCNLKQNVEHHGVHMLEEKVKKLTINEDNKNDVIRVLGPPSVESNFDNDLMFFIERKILVRGLTRLGKRQILTNNVLIAEVDNRGILVKKEFIDLNQMNDLEISTRITEIDYQKTSFIYDFLSSMRQKVNDPLGKKTKK